MGPTDDHRDRLAQLGERQLEVLTLIASGLSNQQICEQLFIGINTLKTHIRGIYRVIGVDSRARAIVWAHRSGLVDLHGDAPDREPDSADVAVDDGPVPPDRA